MLAAVAGGLAGCTKAGISGATTSNSVTYVSIMNLAPYSPWADIYLNGTLATAAGGIAPGKYSTSYGLLQPGDYDVQFKVAGADSLLAEIPSSAFDTMAFTTLILYNSAGSATVQAIKIADNFSNVSLTSGNYRFFNMSPDEPGVDFYFNDNLVQSARQPADNVANPAFNLFQSVSPDSYTLQVKKAGSDSVLATLNNVTIAGGNAYTIFLFGKASALNINVLPAVY
jgi:hypothetical protein